MNANSPYIGLPETAFWRSAVADMHFIDLSNLADIQEIPKDAPIATGGSCFAQHIGNHLKKKGINYLDYEPLPDYIAECDARRYGFRMFSCRYGNIYTARQLYQLALEATGKRIPKGRVWQKDGRYFDALRPSVDPIGYHSEQDVLDVRKAHLSKVKSMICDLDIFIFTLGLTEAWLSKQDGTVYPSAPGTIAGDYVSDQYEFHNFRSYLFHKRTIAHQETTLDIYGGQSCWLTAPLFPRLQEFSKVHMT